MGIIKIIVLRFCHHNQIGSCTENKISYYRYRKGLYISSNSKLYVINVPVKELAVCQVFKNGTLLLIKSTEGVNKDKWNAPGGEIVQGETPAKAAMKYLYQQTGLYSNKVTSHGTVRLALNGKTDFSYRLHVFSTKTATGDPKPNVEGELKWFNLTDIPYYEMWADDRYWLTLVMQGKQFEADFFLDEKNEKVVKYQIKEKQQILTKIIPVLVLLLIIAVVGYGVSASGILAAHPSNKPTTTISKGSNTIFVPTNSAAGSTSTILVTTTVPALPVPYRVSIDNIDLTLNYSGPPVKGDVTCDVESKSQVVNYHRYLTNSTFLMNITFTDAGCAETITDIYTTTPGFEVVSVVPSLPLQMPASSQSYFDIRLFVQNKNFSGPLSITESYR